MVEVKRISFGASFSGEEGVILTLTGLRGESMAVSSTGVV